MYLIYVTAKDGKSPTKDNDDGLPEVDLQPIMLAISKPNLEYILREADSKEIEVDKPKGHDKIERIFVRLRSCDDEGTEGVGYDDEPNEAKSFEESIEEGDAQMAIALATIYFGRGKTEPYKVDYLDHVRTRTRLADKIVVAGYADEDCTMEQSEEMCLRRALRVRETLVEDGGIEVPIVAVSRPKCCYAEKDSLARRVEVTALFNSKDDDGQLTRQGGHGKPVDEEDPDSSSIKFEARVANAISGSVQ